ncbi:MAG: DoxX family protein, partial [Pseudomonadota bacterium]
ISFMTQDFNIDPTLNIQTLECRYNSTSIGSWYPDIIPCQVVQCPIKPPLIVLGDINGTVTFNFDPEPTEHSQYLTNITYNCVGEYQFFDYPIEFSFGELNILTFAASAIEVVGGILIMIGLFTRPAAFVSSGTMAIGYWIAHGTHALLPIENGGELAALYCFIFLYISTRGSGIWALGK